MGQPRTRGLAGGNTKKCLFQTCLLLHCPKQTSSSGPLSCVTAGLLHSQSFLERRSRKTEQGYSQWQPMHLSLKKEQLIDGCQFNLHLPVLSWWTWNDEHAIEMQVSQLSSTPVIHNRNSKQQNTLCLREGGQITLSDSEVCSELLPTKGNLFWKTKWNDHPSRSKIIMERSDTMESSAPLMELEKREERSYSVSASVEEFPRSRAIGDHLQPSLRWQIPALTASWQISPPSQGGLFASFQDGQRDAASCISTPNCFLCDTRCPKLLCAHKLDRAGTSPSPQHKS